MPLGAVVIATGEIIKSSPVYSSVETVVEVLESEAIEEVDVTRTEIDKTRSPVEKTEYSIDKETGVTSKKRMVFPTKSITQKRKQIREEYWLDDKTGKMFTHKGVKTLRDVSGVEGKEYFPYVDTTTRSADPRVYGVWHGKISDDSVGHTFGQDNLPVYLISQVGLFKVRVTDTGGDISNGDWLETSTRPMEAQKQSGPEKLNSTLGKSLMDVVWAGEAVDPALGYKWKLIPVIF